MKTLECAQVRWVDIESLIKLAEGLIREKETGESNMRRLENEMANKAQECMSLKHDWERMEVSRIFSFK